MRKSALIAGGAMVVVVAIGLSIGWAVKHRRRPAPVKAAAAVSRVFEGPEITLTGQLQARETEQVDAPVAGVLDAWFVDIGAEVYEDQLVGRIRNADLDNALENAQAAVDRAEIRVAQLEAKTVSAKLEVSRTTADQIRGRDELDRAEKLYQRYQKLMDADAIARLTFQKSEADYKTAKADAANRDAAAKDAQDKAAAIDGDSEEAKRDLAAKTAALAKAKEDVAAGDLHSPADGVVLARNVHQGDHVEEGQESLLTVATELTKQAVALTPDAAVLPRIHAGQHAFVRVSDAEIPGEVKEVRGAEVLVEFTSAEPMMKLGTAAQVRIVF